MRLRTTLAVFGLIAAMGMSQGCQTFCDTFCPGSGPEECCQTPPIPPAPPFDADGPWLKPGIIRVKRMGNTIAFVSRDPDPLKSGQQHWVLQADEELPLDVGVGTILEFVYENAGSMTLADLCADSMYGGNPALLWWNADAGVWVPPQGWTLFSNAVGPSPCP